MLINSIYQLTAVIYCYILFTPEEVLYAYDYQ